MKKGIISLAFIFTVLFGIGQSKYILIKDAEMMRSGILKPNAAILITDKQLIKNDEALFLGNYSNQHACGYHYTIQFWKTSDKLIEEFPFNQECEEFVKNNNAIQSKMREYIKILETKPTHYIYNLKVPVTIEPDKVIQALNNSNLTIFFITGKTEYLSFLTFTYLQTSKLKEMDDKSKWDGEEKANEKLATDKINLIVSNIKKITQVIEKSKISFPMSSFGMTIDHKAQITLKFKNNTDLTKVKEVITSNGGKVETENKPDYYYIQLVDQMDNLKNIIIKLKKFDFINDVYEYPFTKK